MKILICFFLYATGFQYFIFTAQYIYNQQYNISLMIFILFISTLLLYLTYQYYQKNIMQLPIIVILSLEIAYIIIYALFFLPSFTFIILLILIANIITSILISVYLYKDYKALT